MKKLKIGIIGVGNISYHHITGYLRNPNVELYAFCDINEERLREKGERYGITRLYTDVDEMMKALPELDAVSVCVWNCNHAKCTIAALNAGKHVLCEKPIATTLEEAQAMIDAAEKNNRLLMVGFCCRYGTDAKLIRDFRDDGFFGDFYHAKAAYLRRNGNPGGWFSDITRSAGGPLIDLGVHIIDLTRWLMGNPKPVSVYGVSYRELLNRPGVRKSSSTYFSAGADQDKDVCTVEDFASALVRYDNGASLQVECSYSLNLKEDVYSLELFGTKGGVKFAPNFEMYTDKNGYMLDITPSGITLPDDDRVLFDREMDHFVDCIQNGTPCMAPAKDGYDILKMMLAVYESAKTGHEVVLD